MAQLLRRRLRDEVSRRSAKSTKTTSRTSASPGAGAPPIARCSCRIRSGAPAATKKRRLMVNGTIYTVTGPRAGRGARSGNRRHPLGLRSRELQGRHAEQRRVPPARTRPTGPTARSERLFVGTADAYLLSIDARTGKPDPAFGTGGKADLTVGVPRRGSRRRTSPPDVRSLPATSSSSATRSRTRSTTGEAPPGICPCVRRANRQTRRGRSITIPRAGEFGIDTWLDNSSEYTGSANVWSSGIYDPELDYVYLPTSTPTNNYYGGHRPGNNLFAESLVCLEAKTGKRVWHFQAVHHGIWDYDFPDASASSPISPSTAGRSKRSFRSASRRSRTCSTARAASRSGRSKSGPFPRSTVPGERIVADAARSRPSRRRSISRAPPRRTSSTSRPS